jgi:hypothetical protein
MLDRGEDIGEEFEAHVAGPRESLDGRGSEGVDADVLGHQAADECRGG